MPSKEEWRDINDFEGLYKVSNLGRVYSIASRKCLVPRPDSHGHTRVCLGRGNDKTIHRLVAEAFIPNPNSLPLVNHKDENKANNAAHNLEWCTAQYNQLHSAHKWRKAIQDGIIIASYSSLREASTTTGISKSNISSVCHKRLKTAGGYEWRYLNDN